MHSLAPFLYKNCPCYPLAVYGKVAAVIYADAAPLAAVQHVHWPDAAQVPQHRRAKPSECEPSLL